MQTLVRLAEQRRWKQLRETIFDHYTELLGRLDSLETPTPDDRALAGALQSCIQHSTQDKDVQLSLALDFGNYISLCLESGDYVPLWTTTAVSRVCKVCLEEVDSSLYPVAIHHRSCRGFIAHLNCYERWTQAGQTLACEHCD